MALPIGYVGNFLLLQSYKKTAYFVLLRLVLMKVLFGVCIENRHLIV